VFSTAKRKVWPKNCNIMLPGIYISSYKCRPMSRQSVTIYIFSNKCKKRRINNAAPIVGHLGWNDRLQDAIIFRPELALNSNPKCLLLWVWHQTTLANQIFLSKNTTTKNLKLTSALTPLAGPYRKGKWHAKTCMNQDCQPSGRRNWKIPEYGVGRNSKQLCSISRCKT